MRKPLALLATIAVAAATPSHANDKLKVVASFSIIADMARNVGGDHIALTTLVGPGGDAHVYEPKPADAAALHDADVILVNGLGLEGFLSRLAEASATKAPVVELTKGVEPRNAEEEHDDDEQHAEDGHDHDDLDPHAFQSVANAEIYVRNIAEAFCKADLAACDGYKANAAAYTEQLKALDGELKAEVSRIPEDRRTVITTHDAFGYFANAYGLRFLAPEGVSTDAEASASDIATLIRQIREDHASALFLENISDPRLMQRIADETGVAIGGTLYSDALSPPNGPAATYIELMRYNIRTIEAAIAGN